MRLLRLSIYSMLAMVTLITGYQAYPVYAAEPEPVAPATAWVNSCSDWDDWDKAGPAYRIYGNSYYVGTCGISAILITGANGHILIDGATAAGADVIAANIRALGFALTDVKLLLQSHEHFDHVAGLAKLQQLSGARLLASAAAAPVLASGVVNAADPQAGMHQPFPAARVDGQVTEGEAVHLGELSLLPIATPGHTPGALSWQWTSCEAEQCQVLVYADSLSPVSSDSYRFSEHLSYLNAYRAGLSKLAKLDCQILLTPHPSASNMRTRLQSESGLSDAKGCQLYADAVTQRLQQRLAKENTPAKQ
ncbi:MAG: subclass B3 metallo-beta-lactamase [Gammaproteobacteria bacterium]|nr:subclass B3 metallo-beta-lactamase [Gammaproteobacteria bacterium]MBU1553934.1 subclass B3 metallo-beta-lactamase [Gammaproteobacteria bacterium]MBU2070678.1 subclass B3 metallo-beta-lactamase [Gammaproteobacteria bacterium]MBU2184228.1 subclass B3 metallo-beta-lactamase [Gammaproteobacteria bacterium]MBU2206089.1 subclass B3 metallo-beta-lactamase [Gammaproteobacteria bacterium]